MTDLSIINQGVTTEGEQSAESSTEQISGETKTISIDEHKKEIAKYESLIDQIKRSQSGSDKLVTDLQKKIEELHKSQMSDKERIEYEKKLAEQEKLSFEREKQKLEVEKLKLKFIAENKIDLEFADFLNADTEGEIKNQFERLNTLISKHIKPLEDELNKLRANLGRPNSGNGAGGNMDWKKATLSQKTQEFNRIKKEQGEETAIKWFNSIN